MTEDEKDDLALKIAKMAVEAVGPVEAPGILWQALIAVHAVHHSLESAVTCISAGLESLRRDLADSRSGRTLQ